MIVLRQSRSLLPAGKTARGSSSSHYKNTVCSAWSPVLFLLLLLFATLPCSVQASSESRDVVDFALPPFSMLVNLNQDAVQDETDDYLLKGTFYQSLLDETQAHLSNVFLEREGEQFEHENFIQIKLVSKLRLGKVNGTDDATTIDDVQVYAGFSGVVTYSFPSTQVPSNSKKELDIQQVLRKALSGQDYINLLKRYTGDTVLSGIDDLEEIRVGTELVQLSRSDDSTLPPFNGPTNQKKSSSGPHLNPVAIVGIAIMISLFCALGLFGAAVIMLLRDRAQQEKGLNGQAMDSIGMGVQDEKDKSDPDVPEETAVWKKATLKILSKALMVRRYWKKAIRQAKKNRKKNRSKTEETEENIMPAPEKTEEEDDDDDDDSVADDIYYDGHLTDEEAANLWLDSWSQSLTSIPLSNITSASVSPAKKHVKKKKTSRAPWEPRPASRQKGRVFLGCIAEEDSVVDSHSIANLRSHDEDDCENPAGRDRIREMANAILEEEYDPSSLAMKGESVRRKRHIPVVEEKKEGDQQNDGNGEDAEEDDLVEEPLTDDDKPHWII